MCAISKSIEYKLWYNIQSPSGHWLRRQLLLRHAVQTNARQGPGRHEQNAYEEQSDGQHEHR